MLARMITFHADGGDLAQLVDSLRSEMPSIYDSLSGFRGIVVLEDNDESPNHVVAVTLWEDEASLAGSEAVANVVVDRIARATKALPSRKTYTVLGTMGIADRPTP